MGDPPTQPVRVLLVDDHSFFRQGMRAMLENGGIDVVGEAGDGVQAIELTRVLRPDVLVMDLRMPRLSGIEATREIVTRFPGVRVLVLSASGEAAEIRQAMAAGASGYLTKDATSEELCDAVGRAAAGTLVLGGEVAMVVREVLRSHGASRSSEDATGRLSARELEVLRMMTDGADNRAIAVGLFISPNTVKQHVANIFEKLGVRSRAAAVGLGVRSGLV